jgi:hypothetical protein
LKPKIALYAGSPLELLLLILINTYELILITNSENIGDLATRR